MKRLGITHNADTKKTKPPWSVDEEKKRIQSFIDAFFDSDANANKFSEAEKRKFAQNFKKAFIESKLGDNPLPPKSNAPKLKALPAPPIIKEAPAKPATKPTLPALPKKEEKPKEDTEQKLGNVRHYSNAFVNNYNFVTKNSAETESHFEINSNFKETEMNESLDHKYAQMSDDKYFSPNSDKK